MASQDDILKLRRMTGEVDDDAFSNTDMDLYITEAGGDLNAAAAAVWADKASGYADLVDITEAGSSRKNSDLYKNASAQATYYQSLVTPAPQPGTFSTTRPIKRP